VTNPVASVVIPAHNEEAVIGRALDTLLLGSDDGEFDVIVVANACTDRTADVARMRAVRVIETEKAGKANAISIGDAACLAFPRIYADADVQIDVASLRAIVRALGRDGVLAAAPRGQLDLTGVTRQMRRVHSVHDLRMAPYRGLSGVGVYAVSQAGHDRLFPLPDIIADDEFAHRSFAPGERVVVEGATSTVRPARTLRAHLRRRIRVRQGMRQLDSAGFPATGPGTDLGLTRMMRERTIGPLDAATYLGVLLVDRVLGRYHSRRPVAWTADETSRTEEP
jgi:hypothetical protein